jgi:hypothetical protein
MVQKQAIIKSVIFHVVIVVAFVVSIPYLSQGIAPEQPILTVDIVNSTPETNLEEGIKGKAQPAAPTESAPTESTEEDTAEDTPPPAPPTSPPAAPKVVEAAEAVAVPDAELQKVKPKEPKPNVEAPLRRPVRKSPAFKKRQQEQARLNSALADLTERSSQQRRKQEDKDKKKQAAKDKLDQLLKKQAEKEKQTVADADPADTEETSETLIGQALNTRPKSSGALGVSDIDRLRNHIRDCWSPPPGASGADALIVDIIVRLDEDAQVQGVEVVDKARLRSDATFKAAAQAAQRAMFDCSPLPLPSDEYDTWKELEFEFNPSFITRS